MKKGIKILYYVGLIVVSLAGGFIFNVYVATDISGITSYNPGDPLPYSKPIGIPFRSATYSYRSEKSSTPAGCRNVEIEEGQCGYRDEPNFGINSYEDLGYGCIMGKPACFTSEINNVMQPLNVIFWSGICFVLLFMIFRWLMKKRHLNREIGSSGEDNLKNRFN